MRDLPINQIQNGDWIEVASTMPDQCVHCIVTSPPYWGQRNYGVDGQLGLEETFEEHIEKLVAGFREIRRILRDDGILWVNYGCKMTDTQDDMMALRDDLTPSEISYVLNELGNGMKHRDTQDFPEDG